MICIIPARGGSQRIPKKNIRNFHGKPIIAYSIETAKEVCSRVIVSTDDPEIANVANEYGAEIHHRSEEMSKDDVGTQEVAKNVIEEVGIDQYEEICVLYATSPFVTVNDLYASRVVLRGGSYVVSTYSHRVEDCGNFYIGYAFKFLKDVPLSDANTILYPLKHAIDINTEEDWIKAEKMWEEING